MPKLSEIPPQETPLEGSDLVLIETTAGTRTNTRAMLLANARATITGATTSLANGATGNVTMPAPLTIEILAIETSAPARVRIYSSTAARAADAARSITIKPTAGTGLILETVHTSAAKITLDPHAHGSNMASPPVPELYAAITNTGNVGIITITLTCIERERT